MTRHGTPLERPNRGDAESLWEVVAGALRARERTNPRSGEAWWLRDRAIRPSTAPLTDAFWAVDEATFRMRIAATGLVTPVRENLTGTKDASNRVFTTALPIDVSMGPLVALRDAATGAFGVTGESEITLDAGSAPASGDSLWIVYWPDP